MKITSRDGDHGASRTVLDHLRTADVSLRREAREASWKAFQADPAWQTAKAASERDGKLVEKVESVYLNPTDYSPLQ